MYNSISLLNFPVSHIDTVYVKTYDRNTSIEVGSVRTHASGTTGNLTLILQDEVRNYYDYVIEIPSLGKTYKISGISLGKEVCKDCAFMLDAYYEVLDAYLVNDSLQEGSWLYLLY